MKLFHERFPVIKGKILIFRIYYYILIRRTDVEFERH